MVARRAGYPDSMSREPSHADAPAARPTLLLWLLVVLGLGLATQVAYQAIASPAAARTSSGDPIGIDAR